MSPRPVLFLSHTAEVSGAELSLLSLIGALDPSRFQPLAVLPGDGPLLDRLVERGIPSHVSPLSSGSLRRPGGIFKNLRLLRAFTRAHGIRLIHANSFHAIKQAAPLRKIDATPLVGHVRDIVPFTRLTRAAIFSCDRVICVSRAAAENLAGREVARQGGPVRVIHNGVDPAAFASLPPREEALGRLGLGDIQGPTVGIAAPLVRWKGQEVFLRAAGKVAERIPEAAFLVAGGETFAEPGYVDGLRAASESGALKGRVRFLGFTRRLRELFAALDVVVCASVEPDPLPRAVLEAMISGRAVVASAAGGVPEAIEDGLTGLLVPPGDPEALAAGILRLLEDGPLRRRIGEAASASAVRRFSLKTHAERVMVLYDELVRP